MLYIPCSNGSMASRPIARHKHRSPSMSTHEWSALPPAHPVVKITKLRSRRCQRCRWRKIKCDENWPTCTPCVKARCPCSGPPASLDSSDSDGNLIPPGSVMHSRAGSPVPSLVSLEGSEYSHHNPYGLTDASSSQHHQDTSQLLSHYEYPGGSSYSRVRLASAPRSYPTTTADRVASRLVGYLEPGSRFHASLAADYFRFLPARIGSSAALRDAVALFCTGWGNFRRATPPRAPLVDPRAYGKALRSLQRALSGDDNEGKQLAVETLAAASVMDRVEVLFGSGEARFQCVTHAQGVYSLMAARGPPQLDDELDVCLAFANHHCITSYLLTNGGDDFYLSPRWRDAMSQAAASGVDLPGPLLDFFFVCLDVGGFPALKASVQAVADGGVSDDPIEQTAEAAMLWEKLEGHRAAVETLREGIEAEARRVGHLIEKPLPSLADDGSSNSENSSFVPGVTVELAFTELEPLARIATLSALAVALNRMQLLLCRVLCPEVAPQLDAELRGLCELVWSCLPQIDRQGPGAVLLFSMPLAFSLEAGGTTERTRVLNTMHKLASATGKLPSDLGMLEQVMLSDVRLWTGWTVPGIIPTEEDAPHDELIEE